MLPPRWYCHYGSLRSFVTSVPACRSHPTRTPVLGRRPAGRTVEKPLVAGPTVERFRCFLSTWGSASYRAARPLGCVRLVTTFSPVAEGPAVIANRTAISSSAATAYTTIPMGDAYSRLPLLATIP